MFTAKRLRRVFLFMPLLLLASCGSEQSSQLNYKDTKSIVLDILKTEEAEKTIREAAVKKNGKTFQLLSTNDGQQMQLAVKDVLTKDGLGVHMLEQTMTDPKFAGEFAKASQKNLKQLQKDLLKDPEYMKAYFAALNNSDYEKIILETMKSPKYRQQMMDVIRESLQSPLFKTELIQMFQKAIQEETKPSSKSSDGQSKDGGSDGQGGNQ